MFDALLKTAVGDFHALQIPDGDQHIIAAGIPWFATIFGRDSIIAAYQSLSLNPQLAVDTLRVLARYQGKEYNDWRDEEPGKILHEYRNGEMTRDGEMPFGPYYGSIDATPLFLILLSETFNWTADEQLVEELLPNAYAALEWIDKYGDLDGDGFVEYQRRSPKGLSTRDGKIPGTRTCIATAPLPRRPIALCEVQGYVYDAKYRMSSLLRSFGDMKTRRPAEARGVGTGPPLRSRLLGSEPGLLCHGSRRGEEAAGGDLVESRASAVYPHHQPRARAHRQQSPDARRHVQRLGMADHVAGRARLQSSQLSSRLRLAARQFHHRPWHGAQRNARWRAASFTSLYQAACSFRDYRLPELFCGVQRREYDEPVHYPVSCSPQAWASGAMFLILTLGAWHSAERATEGTEHHQSRSCLIGSTIFTFAICGSAPAASGSTSPAAATVPFAMWSTWKAISCW